MRRGVKFNVPQLRLLDAVYKDKKDRICLVWGRKTGKTRGFLQVVGERTACLPGRAGYVIGPTRKQQLEIVWNNRRLHDIFPKSFKGEPSETQSRISFDFPGQTRSFVKVDGSEEYESYRGTEYDTMAFDEAQACDWRFYDSSYPNLSVRSGLLLVSGTIDPNPLNPFNLKVQEWQNDSDWAVIFATSWENVANIASGKGYDYLSREKEKYYAAGDGAQWEREYEARFVFGGKRSVFPMYGDQRIVKPLDVILPSLSARCQYVVAFDPSQSCFGVLFLAIDPATSYVYVLDEIYETSRSATSAANIWARTLAAERKLMMRDPLRVYDEAAAWFENEMAAQHGIGVTPSQKNSISKEDNISLVKDILLGRKLVIADHCRQFEREMTAYEYDENNKVVKKQDHLIDCLFYGLSVWGYRATPEVINVTHAEATKDLDILATPQVDGSVYGFELDYDEWY